MPPGSERPAATVPPEQDESQEEASESSGGLPPARLEQLFQRAGWAATAVLVLFALHGVLTSGGTADARVPDRLQVGGLLAERIEGQFVENALGGRLYVVTGRLKNASDRPFALGAPLRLGLVDEDGLHLAVRAAYVGWTLPEKRLREDPPDALAAALEAGARQWVMRALEPGESRRFAAVFPSLPREAQRLSFEVVR